MSETEETLEKSNTLTASGAEVGLNAPSHDDSEIPLTLCSEALPQVEPQHDERYRAESGESNVEKLVDGERAGEVLSDTQVEIKDVDAENSELFIIQNSDGVDINLDSEFLLQVKKAIEESGNDCKSVMIRNEGNNESTTYIINVVDDSQNSDSILPTTSSILENCTIEPLNVTSALLQTTSSPSSSVETSLVDVITTNPQSASSSFTTSNPIRIELPPNIELNNNTDISVSCLSNETITSPVSSLSTSDVQFQNLVTLSSQLAATSHQTTISSTTSPSVTTSQVAEQLISIAKRMMDDKSQGSQKISVDESLGKIVIASPEVKQIGEKTTPESVITMYLSSPNDLKCKLNQMKTNSPVIVMQPGEETLSYDENKENPPQDKVNVNENLKSVYNENASEVVTPNEGKVIKSDGIMAALSTSIPMEGTVYRCSECCYSSHNKHYYKQHVDLVHNEDRPYKCPFCDYAGKRRHALLEHMVVHSNQRPFTCNHCNATFRKKGHLTNHIKLHMSHRLVHCGVCNIQLPDTEAFEAHLRKIHRTDKLYKCKLCDHTVVDRNSMLAHLATHNESVVFSCPYCATYFETEKTLLSHMTDAHKVSIHTATIDASNMLNRKTVANIVNEEEALITSNDDKKCLVNTFPANKNSSKAKTNQGANIVCSECGFICADTHIMKKHMWIHIDSTRGSCVQLKDQACGDKCSESKDIKESSASSNAMGVLKMNVVSGMKSLPDNIVYQCTTCKFTSKDNSIFIKHMLLHKTQQKKQEVVQSSNKPQGLESTETDNSQSVSSTMPVLTAQLNSGISKGVNHGKKVDNAVPFVYDQSTCRYRCLICGYHCDFQRTIKAHIWKHSGNQNIDYPVFEQGKKIPAPSSTYFNTMAADSKAKVLPKVDPPNLHQVLPNANSVISAPISTAPSTSININTTQTQSVVTPMGKVVQLLPFKPPLITLTKKDNPKYTLENLPILNDKTLKQEPVVATSSALTSISEIDFETKIEPSLPAVKTSECIIPSSLLKIGNEENITTPQTALTKEQSQALLENNPDFDVKVDDCTVAQNDIIHDEGCTEPAAVVEIVDSTPPDLAQTGIVCQEDKWDVSDVEKSDSDAKDVELCEEVSVIQDECKNESVNQREFTKSEQQATKYNLRKPKDSTSSLRKNTASRSKRSADHAESRKLEPREKKSKQSKNRARANKKVAKPVVNKKSDKSDDDNEETSTDDTQSAEEAVPVVSQPKSGICSSLLAVIEQLRERSRTEEIIKRSSRRSKKSGNSDCMSPLELIHNIERINVAGEGMKLRCNLCHYTSFRLSNMKVHMKTHRQKKPSECSLCDFASASPELLQEHMLQHCKVRTYTCKFCPQSFNHKSALRAHMRMHKEHEPLLCAYCVFETSNPNEFREHMLVHSGCSSRLRCPGCDYIMNSKDELTPHLMKCKGQGNGNDSESSSTESDKNIPPKQPVKSENKHKQKKKVVNEQIKKEKTADEVQTNVSSTSGLDQHSCVVSGCTFSSTNLKELQEHLSVHCNPSLMLCDLCDFKALHSRSLKSHMKRHANDQRFVQQPLEQYKCTLCGYVCHHLPSLKSHMWRHASDQSYSYEFTNDVINAAIDHDSRSDGPQSQADDPELLHRFIHSESRIMEGELTNYGKGNGQRPTCWVRFCCCSCGFETINKAKLNIHMRSHSDVIQNALDVSTTAVHSSVLANNAEDELSELSPKLTRRVSSSWEEDEEHSPPKKMKQK